MPPLPDLVRPMLATPGELPEDDAGWAYEMKWDGVRAVAYVDGGRVRLMSRNDLDITRSYPEVAEPVDALGSVAAVLDGELVTFDERGAPHFGRLQQRMHVQDAAAARRLARTVPVVYLVFDVLHLDGRPTVDLPYDERRALLDGLGLAGTSWQTPPAFDGPGADVLAASRENGLEGVVAKRRTARYRPGARSADWLKVKHVRMQEVVVVGWRPGKGARAQTLGALVLGVHDDAGALRPAGSVGTGFTRRMLDDLLDVLRPLEVATSPFAERLPGAETRDVHWVRPQVVGEVAFTEWTSDGRLRHPSWRGLRPDKAVGDVVREP
ncbi:non-homologous end-joining DNA ligase [Cellulomonas sp.]|uniref:non-homologous end-joining DNA ligase n=1 Tax=Cellulomonas sp. TaxID=40001 RepID=UPI001B0C2F7B|nr:non-homologous end-joining DNA ligase [Cellulomonas sp.]MBO9556366.1 non-homologous end-joining DNA ligase [Cellulomonas sp.]